MNKGIICTIAPRTPFIEETLYLYFHITLGQRPNPTDKTKLFIPLPQEKAEKLERHFAMHLPGEVLLKVEKDSIQWNKFYPFGTREDAPLRGTRIGELVHHAIVEHLADNYPNRKIYHTEGISDKRRQQLLRMQLDPIETYEIETYRHITRKHMEKEHGMHF